MRLAEPFDVCGGRSGCFEPSYRLRFFSSGKLLLQVEPDGGCGNLEFSVANQKPIQCHALTKKPEAQELSRQLQSLFPWLPFDPAAFKFLHP